MDPVQSSVDVASAYYDVYLRKVRERFEAFGYQPSDQYNEILKLRLVRGLVEETLSRTRAGLWVDYGCGPAYLFRELRIPDTWRCIGVEVCRDIIEESRERFALRPNFSFLHATDPDWLQLPPGSADLVSLVEVIEHLSGSDEVLTRLHRVLAPGGRIVVATPNRNRAKNYLRRALPMRWCLYLEDRSHTRGIDEIEEQDDELAQFEFKTHVHEYTMPELCAALERAGFVVERRWTTALKIIPNRLFNRIAGRWPNFVRIFTHIDNASKRLPISLFKLGMVVLARKPS